MTRFSELKEKWMKAPEFREEYRALENEFRLADALIRAHDQTDIAQEDVARTERSSSD